jgi:BirA family biotin operon repressor/biotin-[acetyl-CoA-carboxylase] ligase
MPVHRRLLQLLSDGRFHSGETLGSVLGVSRAAVWKQVRQLEAVGLRVHSVRGKGHRLAEPLELLDQGQVLGALEPEARHRLADLEVFPDLGSTSDHLRQHALSGAPGGTVCLAERQTAGRGRRGRTWVSPFGSNLYLSLLWELPGDLSTLSGLSLAAGVGLLRALHGLGFANVGLKWPNDLVAGGRKLGGVLVEIVGEPAGPCRIVLGVGVNVHMPADQTAQIDQAWTDLHRLGAGRFVSRNRLAAEVLNRLVEVLTVFEQEGFAAFQDEWMEHDQLSGHEVQLEAGRNQWRGRACGVDPSGALLLDTATGIESFAAGELSLRAQS